MTDKRKKKLMEKVREALDLEDDQVETVTPIGRPLTYWYSSTSAADTADASAIVPSIGVITTRVDFTTEEVEELRELLKWWRTKKP